MRYFLIGAELAVGAVAGLFLLGVAIGLGTALLKWTWVEFGWGLPPR